MKEITLTELVIDTLHQFFYGGMTAEEHDEEHGEEASLDEDIIVNS